MQTSNVPQIHKSKTSKFQTSNIPTSQDFPPTRNSTINKYTNTQMQRSKVPQVQTPSKSQIQQSNNRKFHKLVSHSFTDRQAPTKKSNNPKKQRVETPLRGTPKSRIPYMWIHLYRAVEDLETIVPPLEAPHQATERVMLGCTWVLCLA